MTNLRDRLRSERPHTRRMWPPEGYVSENGCGPATRETLLAAGRERLASSAELDALRALHPRRMTSR